LRAVGDRDRRGRHQRQDGDQPSATSAHEHHSPPYSTSSKSSKRGAAISSRKRSKLHGHTAGTPRSSRYQLRQPVTHTVFLAASTRAASCASIASRVALTSRYSPERRRSMSCRMYANCSSATSISEKLPTGPFGPLTMKKFGKPGIEIDIYAFGRGSHASASVCPSLPI